jgi:hypothetical protein
MIEHNRPTDEGLVKIAFDLDAAAWHGFSTETMWAENLGNGRYRLRNIPFYARGVSLDDIVCVDDEVDLSFLKVAQPGGHSTYRVFLSKGMTMELSKSWRELEWIGCAYERATERLVALDIAPSVNIYTAYASLEKGSAMGEWDFEEGHCGHAVRKP